MSIEDRLLRILFEDNVSETTLTQAEQVARMGAAWLNKDPLLNEMDGEICCEWWHKDWNITVYVGDGQIGVLRVWGADMEHEMTYRTTDLAGLSADFTWLRQDSV